MQQQHQRSNDVVHSVHQFFADNTYNIGRIPIILCSAGEELQQRSRSEPAEHAVL